MKPRLVLRATFLSYLLIIALPKLNLAQEKPSAFSLTPNLLPTQNLTAEEWLKQGINKIGIGDFQGAMDDFNQALRLNPNYAEAYFFRGFSQFSLENPQKALEDFNQALRLNPNYAEAYLFRGLVQNNLKNPQKAIEDFNQALRLNPNWAEAYFYRGLVYIQLNKKQEALVDLKKAGELYQQQGKNESYQQVLEIIKKLE